MEDGGADSVPTGYCGPFCLAAVVAEAAAGVAPGVAETQAGEAAAARAASVGSAAAAISAAVARAIVGNMEVDHECPEWRARELEF